MLTINSIKRLEKRLATDDWGDVKTKMIGLLFAHPEHDIVKSEILPFLNHMDIRSGNHIHFFFAGYFEKDKVNQAANKRYGRPLCIVDKKPWYFKERSFLEMRNDLETNSKWKPSGGIDFLLFDAKKTTTGKIAIDFKTTVEMELHSAREKKQIPLLTVFFEKVFRFAEEKGGDNSTWDFSDNQIPSLAYTAIKKFIPSKTFEMYELGALYAVKDHSKK